MNTQINTSQILGAESGDFGTVAAPESFVHTGESGFLMSAPEIVGRSNIRLFRNGLLLTMGSEYDYSADLQAGTVSFKNVLVPEDRVVIDVYADIEAPVIKAGLGIVVNSGTEISAAPDGRTIDFDSRNRLTALKQIPDTATSSSLGIVQPDNETIVIDEFGVISAVNGGSGSSGSSTHYVGGNGISIAGRIIRAKTDGTTVGFNAAGQISGKYEGAGGISVSGSRISAVVDGSTVRISGGKLAGGYSGGGGIAISGGVISAAVDGSTVKISGGKLTASAGTALSAGDGIAINSSGVISTRTDGSTVSVSGGILHGAYEGAGGIVISGGTVSAKVDGSTVLVNSRGELAAIGSGAIDSVGPGLELSSGIVSAAVDGSTVILNADSRLAGGYTGGDAISVNKNMISVLTDGVTVKLDSGGVLSGGYFYTSGMELAGSVVSAKYDNQTIGLNSSGQLYVKTIGGGNIIYAGKGLESVVSGSSTIINVTSTLLADNVYINISGNTAVSTFQEKGKQKVVVNNSSSGATVSQTIGDSGVKTTVSSGNELGMCYIGPEIDGSGYTGNHIVYETLLSGNVSCHVSRRYTSEEYSVEMLSADDELYSSSVATGSYLQVSGGSNGNATMQSVTAGVISEVLSDFDGATSVFKDVDGVHVSAANSEYSTMADVTQGVISNVCRNQNGNAAELFINVNGLGFSASSGTLQDGYTSTKVAIGKDGVSKIVSSGSNIVAIESINTLGHRREVRDSDNLMSTVVSDYGNGFQEVTYLGAPTRGNGISGSAGIQVSAATVNPENISVWLGAAGISGGKSNEVCFGIEPLSGVLLPYICSGGNKFYAKKTSAYINSQWVDTLLFVDPSPSSSSGPLG